MVLYFCRSFLPAGLLLSMWGGVHSLLHFPWEEYNLILPSRGSLLLLWLLCVLASCGALPDCFLSSYDVVEHLSFERHGRGSGASLPLTPSPRPTKQRHRRDQKGKPTRLNIRWTTREDDLRCRALCLLCAFLTLEALRVPLAVCVVGWPWLGTCVGWPHLPLGRSFMALSLYPIWFMDVLELLGSAGAYAPPSVCMWKWWNTTMPTVQEAGPPFLPREYPIYICQFYLSFTVPIPSSLTTGRLLRLLALELLLVYSASGTLLDSSMQTAANSFGAYRPPPLLLMGLVLLAWSPSCYAGPPPVKRTRFDQFPSPATGFPGEEESESQTRPRPTIRPTCEVMHPPPPSSSSSHDEPRNKTQRRAHSIPDPPFMSCSSSDQSESETPHRPTTRPTCQVTHPPPPRSSSSDDDNRNKARRRTHSIAEPPLVSCSSSSGTGPCRPVSRVTCLRKHLCGKCKRNASKKSPLIRAGKSWRCPSCDLPGRGGDKALQPSKPRVLRVGPGLHNHGNSCYLNSILQVMSLCSAFPFSPIGQ